MSKKKQYKPGDRVYCEIYGTTDIVGCTVRSAKDTESEDIHGHRFKCQSLDVHVDGDADDTICVMYNYEALSLRDPRVKAYEMQHWTDILPSDEVLDWISTKVKRATLMGQKMTHVELREAWAKKFKIPSHENV